jgi:hypothetical protein
MDQRGRPGLSLGGTSSCAVDGANRNLWQAFVNVQRNAQTVGELRLFDAEQNSAHSRGTSSGLNI